MRQALPEILTVSTLVALLVAATASADPAPSASDRAPQRLYDITCGYCHGKNVGPIILGRALDTGYIKTMVRNGPNGMPAFRPTEISNSELDALAVYINTSRQAVTEYGQ